MCFFFFNDTATTEIYTLSLHDALPIYAARVASEAAAERQRQSDDFSLRLEQSQRALRAATPEERQRLDRKSTRLNSSHANISYAVFCLKKKNQLYKKTSTNVLTLNYMF